MTEEKKAIISNDSKSMVTMSRYVYECERSYKERMSKRLVIALIITIILLFATNAVWIIRDMQYDYVGTEVNVGTEGAGNANYVGQDGDIYNGKDYGEDQSEGQENQR